MTPAHHPADDIYPTARQIRDFIIDYKAANDGASPSARQIAKGVGLASISTVGLHLKALSAAGLIQLPPKGTSRHIGVVGGRWVYEGEQ